MERGEILVETNKHFLTEIKLGLKPLYQRLQDSVGLSKKPSRKELFECSIPRSCLKYLEVKTQEYQKQKGEFLTYIVRIVNLRKENK